MGKSLLTPKDIVRNRSGNRCEKCSRVLDRNVNGVPQSDAARSIHHRQPKRVGGKDSVVCMVNLCIRCHRDIHEDEKAASLGGWIVLDRDINRVPFLSWQGWVLPDTRGGLLVLDFDTGRAYPLQAEPDPVTEAPLRARRKRVASRPQYDRRRKSRNIARVA